MTVATDLLAVIAKLSSAERELLDLRLGSKWRDYLVAPSALSEQQIADLVCELRAILPELNTSLAETTNSLAVIGSRCAGVRSIFSNYTVLAGDIASALNLYSTIILTFPVTPSANQLITVNALGAGVRTIPGILTKATVNYNGAYLYEDATIQLRWNGTTWDVIAESGTIVYIPIIVYATWTAINNFVLSGGDLIATYPAPYDDAQVISSITKSSGKWYCEITVTATGMDFAGGTAIDLTGIGTPSVSLTNGQVFGFALDMDSGNAYLYVNNVLTATDTLLTGSIGVGIGLGDLGAGCTGTLTANFGASAFTYSVPSGYNAGLYN